MWRDRGAVVACCSLVSAALIVMVFSYFAFMKDESGPMTMTDLMMIAVGTGALVLLAVIDTLVEQVCQWRRRRKHFKSS